MTTTIPKEIAVATDTRNAQTPLDWGSAAACAGSVLSLFFSSGTSGMEKLATLRAKDICEGCPVRQKCLDWALDLEIEYGVYGGLDPRERERLVAREAAA
ncbi:WhiB family transcriptional regulator [Streptomyces sp. AP-93]|uniref:WhiB family transcriptional regulator n=1 Tax=Streptomyces sp. AP-93 TaxID=2929048 RepID=UPI001FAFD04D|nr:WhiB family transcriptional regulator [Streptomyces sp. AP-93]MCJ0868062.1 WhiB family transcriptional regulator [Streptomyces sp. AP-93]